MLTDLEIQKNKEEFISILSSVQRAGMNKLISWLCGSDFFTAPSSTVFHGNYKGGLCEHSLNVYHCGLKLEQIYNELLAGKNKQAIQISQDNIKISTLLHDICKTNFYVPEVKHYKDPVKGWIDYFGYACEDRFPLGHGEKSVFMLQNFIQLTGQEALAIRWHQGWTASVYADVSEKYALGNALKIAPLVSIVIHADAMSTFLLEDTFDPKKV